MTSHPGTDSKVSAYGTSPLFLREIALPQPSFSRKHLYYLSITYRLIRS